MAEALGKLGHEPALHELDGTPRACTRSRRLECDLIFNLTESFGGDDTADINIAGLPRAARQALHRARAHGLILAQDKALAKKIFAFHGIHTPFFARSSAAASSSRTTCSSR